MDELQKKGGKLIYDPGLSVQRHPRSSLRSFAKMLMTYGRGRAEQFRLHPTFGSVLNFVPPLFLVYLIILPGLILLMKGIALAPLACYALAVLGQTAVLASGGQVLRSLAAAPLIVLTHVLYGFGFWRGLFTKLGPPEKRSPVRVVLENV
jgi:hypothetical protein